MSDHETNHDLDSASVSALLELRQFIADELDDQSFPESGNRSFRPLTNGLGLDSPKEAIEKAQQKPKVEVKPKSPPKAPPMPAKPPVIFEETETPRSYAVEKNAAQALARVIDSKPPTEEVEAPELAEMMVPPPLHHVGFVRRAMAGLLDLVFVWTLFLLALGLTVKFLPGGGEFTVSNLRSLQSPLFIRFASLEFATIWLSYFALGFGLLDMTFGMWVWGLRVKYGNDPGKHLGARVLRVFLSFLFYAPIVPLFLLVIQRKGKNLLDLLCGSQVYRTVEA